MSIPPRDKQIQIIAALPRPRVLADHPGYGTGVTNHVWSIRQLIDTALANATPDTGRPRRSVRLRVIEGSKE